MLLVISPAKTLDYETPLATEEYSQPEFLKQSQQLVNELKDLSPQDISSLMKVSDKIGVLNYDRFQSWKKPFKPTNARPAVLAFKGDVYTGLDAASFSKKDFEFAQKHLRILSGLYGVLKPLDLMQPYRLEMGTKFENKKGKDLYSFWGDEINKKIAADVKASGKNVLVNLASNEYFKAVKEKDLDCEIITPVFKDWKNGQYKMISFFAKKARGLMAAYIIKNKIKTPEKIKNFDVDGYQFNEAMSEGNTWVFTRKQ